MDSSFQQDETPARGAVLRDKMGGLLFTTFVSVAEVFSRLSLISKHSVLD
jgi:hypothetical protein